MIEEMWETFRRTCLTHVTEDVEIAACRHIFYGGGQAVMLLLFRDPKSVAILQKELQDYVFTTIGGDGSVNAKTH